MRPGRVHDSPKSEHSARGRASAGANWQNCPGIDPTQQCDEYPFFATEQGGTYSRFTELCGLRTGTPQVGGNSVGGSPFLGIPVPPAAGVPSWYGCRIGGPTP